MRTILLALLILTQSNLCFAGKEVGNGGNGVRIGKSIYVLDLVEAGVESNPFFDSSVVTKKWIKDRVSNAFVNFEVPVDLLSQKLTEIYQIDALLGLAMIKTIEAYSWRLVHKSLVNTNDEDSDVDYKESERVQLAVRGDKTIMIAQEWWKELSPANQVGLITHECAFALVIPRPTKPYELPINFERKQGSRTARQLNSYFYTPEFVKKGVAGLARLASKDFPFGYGELKQEASNHVCSLDSGFLSSLDGHENYLTIEPSKFELRKEAERICGALSSKKQAELILTENYDCLAFDFQLFASPSGNRFYYGATWKNSKRRISEKFSDRLQTCVDTTTNWLTAKLVVR